MSKLLVNYTYENMGLRTTQILGTVRRHRPPRLRQRLGDEAMKIGFMRPSAAATA